MVIDKSHPWGLRGGEHTLDVGNMASVNHRELAGTDQRQAELSYLPVEEWEKETWRILVESWCEGLD